MQFLEGRLFSKLVNNREILDKVDNNNLQSSKSIDNHRSVINKRLLDKTSQSEMTDPRSL